MRLFSSFALVPEFARRLRHHWAAALMGGTIPGIGLFTWTLLGQPPHWAIGTVLVGALLFSAYFTWRDEYLALQKRMEQPPLLRAYVKGLAGVIHKYGPTTEASYSWVYTDLRIALLNAGPPTIIDDWGLDKPTGERIPVQERSLEESLTPDERTRIGNLQDLMHRPLGTGQRKELLLRFVLKNLEGVDDWREDSSVKMLENEAGEYGWLLSFRDVAGVTHKIPLVRKGLFLANAEGPLE
jgi:hypothetical protein